MTNLIALPSGTVLVGDYRVERVLGAGGFGVTYLAEELALARPVTIKEYFPSDIALRAGGVDVVPRSQDAAGDYTWGLERFIEEAQTLAKFNHTNIVQLHRYFRDNKTGYMVLHFEEGQSLKGWLKALGRAPRQKELDVILAPLLDALEMIHKADFLHRDIAPDNVIIRKSGDPVLIDFGSARGEVASRSKTISALVKPGYSPYEQYAETSKRQGPWTDIYAMGATLYHAVTGKRPPDAPSRMVNDEIVPASEAALSSYRTGFLKAIDKALRLNIELRPQSIAAWRGDLLAPDPPRTGWRSRGREKKIEEAEVAASQCRHREGLGAAATSAAAARRAGAQGQHAQHPRRVAQEARCAGGRGTRASKAGARARQGRSSRAAKERCQGQARKAAQEGNAGAGRPEEPGPRRGQAFAAAAPGEGQPSRLGADRVQALDRRRRRQRCRGPAGPFSAL